jgi:hypothetical protein
MTDFSSKLLLIRGICDSWHRWDLEERKAACGALIWFCDLLLNACEQSSASEDRKDYAREKLLSIHHAADAGCLSGMLDVPHVQECAVCTMGVMPDAPLRME